MPPPKTTIDNFPIDISTRYAENEKRLNQPLIRDIKDSSLISKQTQIDVYSPTTSSFLESLTGKITIQSPLASFTSPSEGIGNIVFSYLLIPSLGPSEKIESAQQKILDQIEMMKAERQQKLQSIADKEEEKKKSLKWQNEEEEAEENDAGQKLRKAIELIRTLNSDLLYTNGARKRYTQG